MEAETSYFSLINVNATHFTSTHTVCGHAEACPSTTYDKSISNDARTSRARWLGRYSPQGSRPRGGPRLAALMVQDLYLPQVRKKSTKSEMNHRISLKLCTQVKEQILRTFSCWHFSEKNVLHGFFWVFLVFFSSFSSLINQSSNQRPFSA